jgi:hypothetical protein
LSKHTSERSATIAPARQFSWDSSSSDSSEEETGHPGKGQPTSNDDSSYSSSEEQQVQIRKKRESRKRQEEVLVDAFSSIDSDSEEQALKLSMMKKRTSVHSSFVCHNSVEHVEANRWLA